MTKRVLGMFTDLLVMTQLSISHIKALEQSELRYQPSWHRHLLAENVRCGSARQGYRPMSQLEAPCMTLTIIQLMNSLRMLSTEKVLRIVLMIQC